MDALHAPRTTIASLAATPGRAKIGEYLRALPGIEEVLTADPTLTDLSWLGERVSLHLCDGDTIVEVDPSQLRPLNLLGEVAISTQATIAAGILATSLPAYACVDLADRERAQRFLDLLASRIVLKGDTVLGLPTAYDAYRLPDYRGHACYVISFRVYALKLRLSVAIVGDHLVAATKDETLRTVIDDAQTPGEPLEGAAHLQLRLNFDALRAFKPDLRRYWAERARQACHANLASIQQIATLHGVPVAEVGPLSQAKYGVSYFCPEGGEYRLSASGEQAECSLHGSRRNPRQNTPSGESAAFLSFVETLQRITLSLKFEDEALFATVEVERK
ncbi:MAG: hypothetical protein U1D55_03910 [Phycisphaerae bacterium]